MNARRAPLCSADMQAALVELDLMPLEATDFTCSQPMTIGNQDHRCIAMTTAIHLAGRVHELLDLALGEVASLDCQVYDAWCAFLGCRFHADELCLRAANCLAYTLAQFRGRNAAWNSS